MREKERERESESESERECSRQSSEQQTWFMTCCILMFAITVQLGRSSVQPQMCDKIPLTPYA